MGWYFEKRNSSVIKLEEAKKYQNVFKANLKQIKKGRLKSEDQNALQCTKRN